MQEQSRRKFIKTLSGSTIALCCGSAGLGLLMESCTSIKYLQTTIKDNKISLEKNLFNENKFIILNNDKLRTPIYLTKKNETSYNALLMLCTHKDCEIKPTGNFLSCPCHGSQFSNNGNVLQGPAIENLTQYRVQLNETTIIIDLNQPIQS